MPSAGVIAMAALLILALLAIVGFMVAMVRAGIKAKREQDQFWVDAREYVRQVKIAEGLIMPDGSPGPNA